MFSDRFLYYKELEELSSSKVLVYVTGDRRGLETQIAADALDYFVEHLDKIGKTHKITLVLYTRGGDTLVAWNIVNLIRMFCDELEVIIPLKAHSAGTLISLGADKIIMTKQATLGPIDPSLNTPLNPQIPGASIDAKYPVSVEAIKGFLSIAKDELGIQDNNALSDILIKLADVVHPLVLGQVYRSRVQIKMLAEKLLKTHENDLSKVEKIVSFLSSESGSHDYTINRREAHESLGLKIEKPNDALYFLIQKIYNDFKEELLLNIPLNLNSILGTENNKSYEFKRCLIESITGGCDSFITSGILTRISISQPNSHNISQINDQRNFEGWVNRNV